MASSMPLSEAERLLNLCPPYGAKEVGEAYNVKMRALNNAYRMAVGQEQDRIDVEKVKVTAAKSILLGAASAAPSPRPAANRSNYQRRPAPTGGHYKPSYASRGTASNAASSFVNFVSAEVRRYVATVAQAFHTTPPIAAAIIGLSIMMGMAMLFGGNKRPATDRAAYVLVLSDPMSQVYINGKFLAHASFVNPIRIDAGRSIEFRFVNPEYPEISRTVMVDDSKKYTFKVHPDEGTVEIIDGPDGEAR